MGYRNEIYRARPAAAQQGDVLPQGAARTGRSPARAPLGSFCVPAVLKDWRARGWEVFGGLDHAEKSVTQANPKDASIDGLAYSLHHCHEGDKEKIFLRIDSWCYNKYGETIDLPVLEGVFDALRFHQPAKALDSIKIMARPVRATEKVALRVVNTALFLINQINAGQVPDFERVLELHRLHPDPARGGGCEDEKMVRGAPVKIRAGTLKGRE